MEHYTTARVEAKKTKEGWPGAAAEDGFEDGLVVACSCCSLHVSACLMLILMLGYVCCMYVLIRFWPWVGL